LYFLNQSVNTQAEGGDRDDNYLLNQSVSTANVKSATSTTNGPKIVNKRNATDRPGQEKDDKS
jgi:hypothetical protein